MIEDGRLLATLPSLANEKKIRQILSTDLICGARFNTGIFNPYTPEETLAILCSLKQEYKKDIWIDLKGRQLRVVQWADPMYQCIELNHTLAVSPPAKVILRGEEPLSLVCAKGNVITVDPPPRHAVGRGQSVNILGDDVVIDGYLTPLDEAYVHACAMSGWQDIMLSFVERVEDIEAVLRICPHARVVCKIESVRGVSAVEEFASRGCRLMTARDDLFIELQSPANTVAAISHIPRIDPNAICASRIFESLLANDSVALSDYEDILFMYEYGYRYFLLCDSVTGRCFEKACKAWQALIRG